MLPVRQVILVPPALGTPRAANAGPPSRRIRSAMVSASLWETADVIMTSDHWWRYAAGLDGKMDQRVPFAVRFPGGSQRTTYAEPFNTVALHDLTLAIVDGCVSSSSDVVAWLADNAT